MKSVVRRDVVSTAKPAVVTNVASRLLPFVCAYDELRTRDGDVKGVGGQVWVR